MQCNYFIMTVTMTASDYEGNEPPYPACKAGIEYIPPEDELNKYCKSENFMTCPRFMASLEINKSKVNSE